MSGPKRTIKPLSRRKRLTPEIIEAIRRASELWTRTTTARSVIFKIAAPWFL
jgi:hypothetical protein